MVASCKRAGVKLASLVSFEGEVEMSMTSSIGLGAGSAMTFEVKGDKVRTQTGMLGASMVTISDASAKKTWLLNNVAHTYTEIDLSKPSTTPTITKSAAKANNTGRHDTVAGYPCDVWDVDDPSVGHTEVCVASGVRMFALGLSGPFAMFTREGDAWSEVMSKGFPIRIAMIDTHGTPVMKLEATRIEKKSLPDSDFEVPAGYTKTPSI